MHENVYISLASMLLGAGGVGLGILLSRPSRRHPAPMHAPIIPLPSNVITEDEINSTVGEEAAKTDVLLFIGYGSSAMFDDPKEALDSLRPFLSEIKAERKGSPFIPFTAVYGGDPSDPNAPSIGYFMSLLKREYQCKVLAVAVGLSDHFEPEWDLVYRLPGQTNRSNSTIYGGTDSVGQPVGATRCYLGPGFIDPLPGKSKPSLSGIIVLGGGGVAVKELEYADRMKVPWHYLPCAAKNKSVYNSTYGPVHDWVANKLGAEPPLGQITSGPIQTSDSIHDSIV